MVEKLIEWSARNPVPDRAGDAGAAVRGIVAVLRTPLDALPDLSDVQVIVYNRGSWPGTSGGRGPGHLPADDGDAVGAQHSKVVRGFSFFGASFVYIIFDDGTDLYWARSRVLEYLNVASQRLPPGHYAAARARRHRRRLGLPVRRAGEKTARWPNCARCRTGNLPLPAGPRRPACPRSRRSAAYVQQ